MMDDPGKWTRAAFATSVLCVVLLVPCRAASMQAEVRSTTAAQGYALRSPWGDPVISRRRFTQTLGMTVTQLGSDEPVPDGIWFSLHLQLRLDADFGVRDTEHRLGTYPDSAIPGLDPAPLDLPYGYVDIRNLARGLVSARVGRQVLVDSLGWWAFDGAWARAQLPVFLALESYGGLEQRGGLALSSSRFEPDGVWRGSRRNVDASTYPEFLEASPAPAYGIALETWQLPVVHARVAYRKVWNTGPAPTNSLATSPSVPVPTTSDTRTSSERVGISADAASDELGVLRGGIVYDVPRALVSDAYGSLDAFASRRWTIGADADRQVPTFDGDSIWSWFAMEPTTTALGRLDFWWTDEVQLSGSSGARWVDVASDPGTADSGAAHAFVDLLGRVSARYVVTERSVAVSGLIDRGDRGHREGVDLSAQQWVEQRFQMSGRISLYDWRDDLRAERSATSFGYVLGGGFRPGPQTHVLLEWEHHANRLVGQRYRVLAMLQAVVD